MRAAHWGASWAAALLLAGCAATPPLPELPPTHPASAAAQESPIPPRTATLGISTGGSSAPAATPAEDSEKEMTRPAEAPPSGGHSGHGSGGGRR